MPGPSSRKGACLVCDHPACAQIDAQRGAGVSFVALADRWGIAKSTIARHWWRCVAAERKASYALGPSTLEQARERAAAEGGSVVDHLAIVRSTLMRQLLRQDECDSPFGVAAVAGKLLPVLCELGKISGEILRDTAPSVNVNVALGVSTTPGFDVLRAGLLDLARAHPAARPDVIALLRRAGGGEALPPLARTIEHHPHA